MEHTHLRAEWERQIAIFMAFPHANSDWVEYINEARACFIRIIEHILCFESVILCVDTDDEEGFRLLCEYFKSQGEPSPLQEYINTHINPHIPKHSIAKPYLSSLAQSSPYALHIIRVGTNDTWARDFGGIGISKAGESKMIDFIFNGWGLKYPANKDNQITRNVFKQEHLIQADMVLEGGSIESNGAGVLLTNTQCLLTPNRNPHLTLQDIESKLKAYFGLKQVLWLHHGYLAGDDTDSHIDTLARFISKDSIAYIQCEDRDDEHFIELAKMQEELKALRQPNGKPYNLIALPFTRAIYDLNKQRLPASYANFLFLNNALLVPTYDDPNDTKALEILKNALPTHKVLGVPCLELILWHGSLHCITMQLYEA